MTICEATTTTHSDLARSRLDADGGPALIADWNPAVFIHYVVDPDVLQPLVPFPLDLHEGRAYVSIVAFVQRRLRPKTGGRIGAWLSRPLATHPFCNVRTYVRVDGEPGIYFLAEWIPNRLAAALGPPLYGLPYRLGELRYHLADAGDICGDVIAADGLRFRFHARGERFMVPEPAPRDSLTEFLIERYSAFTMRGRTPLRFRIHHEPWRQVPLEVEVEQDSLLGATGNWRRDDCLICGHHSAGLRDVLIGRPCKLCGMPSPLVRWTPLAVLPPLAGLTFAQAPGWALMWAMAYAIFFGCKWATLLGAGAVLRRASMARILAYLFAWPGMDAAGFLGERKPPVRATRREWLNATVKPASGAILLFAIARLFASAPLLAGWIGMIGAILLLHFGLFHLLALGFRRAGIDVAPIMNAPLRSRSVAEFWGSRWNLGFHHLANELVFRPTVQRLGIAGAVLLTFLASGLVHELVITLPARGGYGLPTLYFVLQGTGVLLERRIPRRRKWARRLFAFAIVGLPVFILFPPPFVLNVFVPFMRVIGAL
ncbi:MAG TPA: DUF2071 domain-containing protein [Tepidisphaeraceae bacterium]|nr:DUF2071 domain-containing protein [Tepidisphaeraceae bacterium]